MVHVYTGNGKGKTTAALGLALRALGDGKTVCMIQFIKGPWPSGEDVSYKAFEPNFLLVKGGKGFVGILGDTLPREQHERAAVETLERAKKEINSGKWDIVILDEVNVAVDLGLITAQEVIDVISDFSDRHPGRDQDPDSGQARMTPDLNNLQSAINNLQSKIIVLTGRNAPQAFIDIADLVTEMKEIKHCFKEGQKAQEGIEF